MTTVKIKKVHNGRYGLKSVATIPKIAGGSGSVKSFSLTINKKGVLTAKCPDGKLQANATAIFSDGTKASRGDHPDLHRHLRHASEDLWTRDRKGRPPGRPSLCGAVALRQHP